MGLKGRNTRRKYLDQVELFISLTREDTNGFISDGEPESIGMFDANVDEMNGSRALYFHSQGYTHPIVVKMYKPENSFTSLSWRGSQADVRSITEDKDNCDCIVIYADIKTSTPL